MGKPIEHKLIFDAPIQKVWDGITGYDKYGEWNEFCPQVEAEFRPKGKLRMHCHLLPDQRPTIQTERFRKIEPPNLLTYGLDYGILLYTERIQRLTAISDTRTEYYSSLRIVGLLTPFVMLRYRDAIDQGFKLAYSGLARFLTK